MRARRARMSSLVEVMAVCYVSRLTQENSEGGHPSRGKTVNAPRARLRCLSYVVLPPADCVQCN